MFKKENVKDNKGFTIIEVLIVLAIAGLILLIVFLAVPALQRNSRNTARSSDAARVSGAISECLSNNNGDIGDCDTEDDIDPSYISLSDNQQLIASTSAGLDSYLLTVGEKCVDNASSDANAGARAYTVTYLVEASGTAAGIPRCVGS